MKIEESLAPEILFHFTNKEALFDILASTFKVSYAREKIVGPKNEREFGVPMVSFCDLRLSQLKTHMSKYGSYGIGLTKDWANKSGLNPVMYLSRHCEFTDGFITGISGMYRYLNVLREDSIKDNITTHYTNLLNTYRYLKNYESEITRNGEVLNVRHADEREWRFVPSISADIKYPIVAISNIDSRKKKRELNKEVEHIRLPFQPNDIKYLIIQDEKEIPELITHLGLVKEKFDIDIRNKLLSRILTAEQIKEDI